MEFTELQLSLCSRCAESLEAPLRLLSWSLYPYYVDSFEYQNGLHFKVNYPDPGSAG